MRTSIYLAVVLVAFSCNKEAGLGGTSSIRGKVYKYEVNGLGQVLNEFYDADRDVYIIYGTEDETYDDKFATSHDGSYEFNGLNIGTYKVYSYTRCDLCPSGDTITSIEVEITEKDKIYQLEDLVIYK